MSQSQPPGKKGKSHSATAVIFGILVIALVAVRYGYNYYRLGATNGEVIEEYREQFDPLRQQLGEIANRLDAEPPVESVSVESEISPSLVLNSGNPLKSNVVVMALAELTDSESTLGQLNQEYIFRPDGTQWFDTTLAWTGPNNPMAQTVLQKNGSDLKEKFEHALSVPYILLGRIHESADGETAEAPEQIRCDAFLVRIETGKILARIPVEVSLSDDIESGLDPINQIQRATLEAVGEALGERITFE